MHSLDRGVGGNEGTAVSKVFARAEKVDFFFNSQDPSTIGLMVMDAWRKSFRRKSTSVLDSYV